MAAMGDEERRRFLIEGTRTAKVGTVRPDGRPHVAPVWFDLDGDDLVFSTHELSVKGRNLTHRPQTTICVDDETPPYAFVIVEGEAELDSDQAELKDWAVRLARRYIGPDRAEEVGAANSGPGYLVVRVRPRHTVSENHVAL